jgi:hypothetical protein
MLRQVTVYSFETTRGFAQIRLSNGRWHVCWRDDGLGNSVSPQQALDDLVGGHTFSPSDGVDTSQLGLPDNLNDWESR